MDRVRSRWTRSTSGPGKHLRSVLPGSFILLFSIMAIAVLLLPVVGLSLGEENNNLTASPGDTVELYYALDETWVQDSDSDDLHISWRVNDVDIGLDLNITKGDVRTNYDRTDGIHDGQEKYLAQFVIENGTLKASFLVIEQAGETMEIEIVGEDETASWNVSVPELGQPMFWAADNSLNAITMAETEDEFLLYALGLEGEVELEIEGPANTRNLTVEADNGVVVVDLQSLNEAGEYVFTLSGEGIEGLSSEDGSDITLTTTLTVMDTGPPPSDVDEEGVAIPLLIRIVAMSGLAAALFLFYSRLTARPLEQNTRRLIYDHIERHPGIHYRRISDDLGIRNGNLTYHLGVLERQDKVKVRKDGIYTRYFPYDQNIDPRDIYLTGSQEGIVKVIIEAPGITSKDISSRLGLSPQTVSYNLKVLYNEGVIRLVREGRTKRCYLVD